MRAQRCTSAGLQLGDRFMQRVASRTKPFVVPATALCARAEPPPEKLRHVSQAVPLLDSAGAWLTGGPQSSASLHSFYCNIDERERGFIGLPSAGSGTALPPVRGGAQKGAPQRRGAERLARRQPFVATGQPTTKKGARCRGRRVAGRQEARGLQESSLS